MAGSYNWSFAEESGFELSESVKNVIYHPELNVFLVFAGDSKVLVVDPTTGTICKTIKLSAKYEDIKVSYLANIDRLVLVSGGTLSTRKDLNGILLLENTFQTHVQQPDDPVILEMSLIDAINLRDSSYVSEDCTEDDQLAEVLKDLEHGIKLAKEDSKLNNKLAKWATVSLKNSHSILQKSLTSLMLEVRQQMPKQPGYIVLSSLMDQLSLLQPNCEFLKPLADNEAKDRILMHNECARRETFVNWPHLNYKWALPIPMSQAGFYFHPNTPGMNGDDRAMCFTCNVCLVYWEATDEPWSEHERHSPACPFIQGEYTNNVPIAATHATEPAKIHSTREPISTISQTTSDKLMATMTESGHVIVWSTDTFLRKYSEFYLNPNDGAILDALNIEDSGSLRAKKFGRSRRELCCTSCCLLSPLMSGQQNNSDDQSILIVGATLVYNDLTEQQQMATELDNVLVLNKLNQEKTDEIILKSQSPSPPPPLPNSLSFQTSELGGDGKLVKSELSSGNICKMASDVKTNAIKSVGTTSPDASRREYLCLLISKVSNKLQLDDICLDLSQQHLQQQQQQLISILPGSTISEYSSDHSTDNSASNQLQQIYTTDDQSAGPKMAGLHSLISSSLKAALDEISDSSEDDQDIQFLGITYQGTKKTLPMASSTSSTSTAAAAAANLVTDHHDAVSASANGTLSFTPPANSKASQLSNSSWYSMESAGISKKLHTYKSNYSNLIRCVKLPEVISANAGDCKLRVEHIIPIQEHNILLVAINSSADDSHFSNVEFTTKTLNNEKMNSECPSVTKENQGGTKADANVSGSWTLLYRLTCSSDSSDKATVIIEEPIAVRSHKECFTSSYCLLPEDLFQQVIADEEDDETNESLYSSESPATAPQLQQFFQLQQPQIPLTTSSSVSKINNQLENICKTSVGAILFIDQSGDAVVFSLKDLSNLGFIYAPLRFNSKNLTTPPNEKVKDRFVSASFCSGMDRICLSTESNQWKFYSLTLTPTSSLSASSSLLLSPCLPDENDMQNLVQANKEEEKMDTAGCSSTSSYENRFGKFLDGATSSNIKNVRNGLLAQKTLHASTLVGLQRMIHYENMMPRFSSTTSTCWKEVQQEQQQRKHPQHLQHGDAAQHTRTWKYQTDSSIQNDENVFELVLPKPASVGHVFIKFTIKPSSPTSSSSSSSSSAPPTTATVLAPAQLAYLQNIRVTLLKQSSTVRHSKIAKLEEKVDFGLSGKFFRDSATDHLSSKPPLNDVDDELYTDNLERKYKAKVICGPVNLYDYLDMTNTQCVLQMTSQSLMDDKCKTLLLHFKCNQNKIVDTDKSRTQQQTKKNATTAYNTGNDEGASVTDGTKKMTNKLQDYPQMAPFFPPIFTGGQQSKGKAKEATCVSTSDCDLIQEISITIRRFKKSGIPLENLNRTYMLEKGGFHSRLLNVICGKDDLPSSASFSSFSAFSSSSTMPSSSFSSGYENVRLHMSLDILTWIVNVKRDCNRYKERFTSRNQQSRLKNVESSEDSIMEKVMSCLTDIIKMCILWADRSLAHKCCRFLAACMIYCEKIKPPSAVLEQSLPSANQTSTSSSTFSSTSTPAIQKFKQQLLASLLDNFPSVITCQSSGSVHWYFSLLNYVKHLDPCLTSNRCYQMLLSIAKEYGSRRDDCHSFLKARMGLTGRPLDSEIFDLDLILLTSVMQPNALSSNAAMLNASAKIQQQSQSQQQQQFTTSGSYAAVVGGVQYGSVIGGVQNVASGGGGGATIPTSATSTASLSMNASMFPDESCFKELMTLIDLERRGGAGGFNVGAGNGWIKGEQIVRNLFGLLDAEPLHFSIHSTSEGTKVEKLDSAVTQPTSTTLAVAQQQQSPLFSIGLTEVLPTASMNFGPESIPVMAMEPSGSSISSSASNAVPIMGSTAEMQLQELQYKQMMLLKLQMHKKKLEQKLAETSKAVKNSKKQSGSSGGGSGNVGGAFQSTASSLMPQILQTNAISSNDGGSMLPPTPKNTPFFMTPPVTPPQEAQLKYLASYNSTLGYKQPLTTKAEFTDASMNNNNNYQASSSAAATTTIGSAKPPLPPSSSSYATTNLSSSSPCGGISFFAWQQTPNVFQTPVPQALVIEKVYSGARRFVVLDFNHLVCLTDLFIPSCSDISSLSIDIWKDSEETDGIRLIESDDIYSCNLIMNDILPPPICRYVKITTIRRYGGNASRSKIPLGSFYGHTYISTWQKFSDISSNDIPLTFCSQQLHKRSSTLQQQLHLPQQISSLQQQQQQSQQLQHKQQQQQSQQQQQRKQQQQQSQQQPQHKQQQQQSQQQQRQHQQYKDSLLSSQDTNQAWNQLHLFTSLYDDIQCKYSLARSRLIQLTSDLEEVEDRDNQLLLLPKCKYNQEEEKVQQTYRETVILLIQLNLARRAIHRLKCELGLTSDRPELQIHAINSADFFEHLKTLNTDHLKFLAEQLSETLLGLSDHRPSLIFKGNRRLDFTNVDLLFTNLCILSDTSRKLEMYSAVWLCRISYDQQWWGDMFCRTFTKYFTADQKNVFAQDRLFLLLVLLGQKTLTSTSAGPFLDKILLLLSQLLQTLQQGSDGEEEAFSKIRDRLDITLVSWLLLFVSKCLDNTPSSLICEESASDDDANTDAKNDNERNVRWLTTSTSFSLVSRWNFLQAEDILLKPLASNTSSLGPQQSSVNEIAVLKLIGGFKGTSNSSSSGKADANQSSLKFSNRRKIFQKLIQQKLKFPMSTSSSSSSSKMTLMGSGQFTMKKHLWKNELMNSTYHLTSEHSNNSVGSKLKSISKTLSQLVDGKKGAASNNKGQINQEAVSNFYQQQQQLKIKNAIENIANSVLFNLGNQSEQSVKSTATGNINIVNNDVENNDKNQLSDKVIFDKTNLPSSIDANNNNNNNPGVAASSLTSGNNKNTGKSNTNDHETLMSAISCMDIQEWDPITLVPRTTCISVAKGLSTLLLSLDSACHVDLFMLACKLLSRLMTSTKPAMRLTQVMSAVDVEKLLMLLCSVEYNNGNHGKGMSQKWWGGGWAYHIIVCLLQDVLEVEKIYPNLPQTVIETDQQATTNNANSEEEEEEEEDATVASSSNVDPSLACSVTLPMMKSDADVGDDDEDEEDDDDDDDDDDEEGDDGMDDAEYNTGGADTAIASNMQATGNESEKLSLLVDNVINELGFDCVKDLFEVEVVEDGSEEFSYVMDIGDVVGPQPMEIDSMNEGKTDDQLDPMVPYKEEWFDEDDSYSADLIDKNFLQAWTEHVSKSTTLEMAKQVQKHQKHKVVQLPPSSTLVTKVKNVPLPSSSSAAATGTSTAAKPLSISKIMKNNSNNFCDFSSLPAGPFSGNFLMKPKNTLDNVMDALAYQQNIKSQNLSLVPHGVSLALDSRLEQGLDLLSEIKLKMLLAAETVDMQLMLAKPLRTLNASAALKCIRDMSTINDQLLQLELKNNQPIQTSSETLSHCFSNLFCQLTNISNKIDFESLLYLWLSVNDLSSYPASLDFDGLLVPPIVSIDDGAVASMLLYVTQLSSISEKTWVLLFRSLKMLLEKEVDGRHSLEHHQHHPYRPHNDPLFPQATSDGRGLSSPSFPSSSSSSSRMSIVTLTNPNFMIALVKFLSNPSSMNNRTPSLSYKAGPLLVQTFHEFLMSSPLVQRVRNRFVLQSVLLSIVQLLTSKTGAIANCLGPLDVQCNLIDDLIDLIDRGTKVYLTNKSNIKGKQPEPVGMSLDTIVDVIRNISSLVFIYLQSLGSSAYKCGTESRSLDSRLCFFKLTKSATSSSPESSKTDKSQRSFANRENLMFLLLKLACKLVQLPLPSSSTNPVNKIQPKKLQSDENVILTNAPLATAAHSNVEITENVDVVIAGDQCAKLSNDSPDNKDKKVLTSTPNIAETDVAATSTCPQQQQQQQQPQQYNLPVRPPTPLPTETSILWQSSHQQNTSVPSTSLQHENVDNLKTCSHCNILNETSKSTVNHSQLVADVVLKEAKIMFNLFSSLSCCLCPSDVSISAFSYSFHQDFLPETVGDHVFKLLITLNIKSSSLNDVVKPLFNYMKTGINISPFATLSPTLSSSLSPSSPEFGSEVAERDLACQKFSEPLLGFALTVLDCYPAIKLFVELGGMRVLCKNMIQSSKQSISTSPSLISSVMQYFSGPKLVAATKLKLANLNVSLAKETVQNLAPLGTISSSSPLASPAHILIQEYSPPRRARSAAWTYHFYPEELWVDLTISLPCVIMLEEVVIIPHFSSLDTCPEAVVIESSYTGSSMSVPLCPTLNTSGMTSIAVRLPRAEVSSSVTIRFLKPKDSNTLGLSQIMLLGTMAFGVDLQGFSKSGISLEESATETSVKWLRLLHNFLVKSSYSDLLMKDIMTSLSATPGLLELCTTMLTIPSSTSIDQIFNIETILMAIGSISRDSNLRLVHALLGGVPPGSPNQQTSSKLSSSSSTSSSLGRASTSSVAILFQLCRCKDQWLMERLKSMLSWLQLWARRSTEDFDLYLIENRKQRIENVKQATKLYVKLAKTSSSSLSPSFDIRGPPEAHVYCLACILWRLKEEGLASVDALNELVTEDFIRFIFNWSCILPRKSSLKTALDYVLCSSFYIRPDLFKLAVDWMDIFHSNLHSIYDVEFEENFDVECTDADDKSWEEETKNYDNYFGKAKSGHEDSEKYSTAGVDKTGNDGQQQSNTATVNLPPFASTSFYPLYYLHLTKWDLMTLSIICGSNDCLVYLEDRDFFSTCCQQLQNFFNDEIILRQRQKFPPQHFHHQQQYESDKCYLASDIIAPMIYFFADLCQESKVKDWLGTPKNSSFWSSLLKVLCTNRTWTTADKRVTTMLSSSQQVALEAASVKFFMKVTSCHERNQLHFCLTLIDTIRFTILPMSCFLRSLVLQVLLDDEEISVNVRCSSQLVMNKTSSLFSGFFPKCGVGYQRGTVIVGLYGTVADVIEYLSSYKVLTNEQLVQLMSSSGHTQQHSQQQLPQCPQLVTTQQQKQQQLLTVYHSSLPNRPLPGEMKLSELLSLIHMANEESSSSSSSSSSTSISSSPLTLNLVEWSEMQRRITSTSATTSAPATTAATKSAMSNTTTTSVDSKITSTTTATASNNFSFLHSIHFPSLLHVFSSIGGLALLAERLPLLSSEQTKQQQQQQPATGMTTASTSAAKNNMIAAAPDWIFVESSDECEEMTDFFVKMDKQASGSLAVSYQQQMSNASSSIPPHSLIAFALFLRLPGYSEILLKEKKKAQCLLRMILGVADEVSSLTFGGQSSSATTAGGMAGNLLSSFPFQVLVCLFDVTPLSTDEGVLLRRMCMEIGVVHLILACLSILGHHAPRQFIPGIYQEILKVASLSQIQQQPSSSSTAAPSTTTFAPTATTSTFAAANANKSDFSAAGVSSINSSVMGLVSGIIKKSGADEKTPNYWAKGTGFGTGSTASNWDAEQLLAKQKCEEEHVTSLLLVLASFISPRTSSVSSSSSLNNFESRLSSRPDLLASSSKTKSSFSNQSSGADLQRSVVAGESSSENSNYLPAGLPALLSQSCLVPALSSYLRNDSVLDMACHVPLYRALLQVLQSIATCQSLISLLLPLPDNNGNDELASSSSSSISSLLDKMRKCVDTYALRLKGNKGQQKAAQMTTASSANTSVASSTAAMAAEDEESEGLALLIPEIQETSVIVNRAIADYLNASGISLTSQKKKDMMSASSSSTMMAMTSSVMGRMSQSQEEKYISVMKLLQYDTYKMVSESNNLPIFTLPHHYESNVKAAGDVNNPVRARRLAQETVTLSTSLPLSVGSSVFVRCDEERLDVMKVLMTGPTDTPYSNGCFEFDVFFPVDYPNSPPLINLETTGGNSIRFNPNLYNDGKVCLSIINTWHGRPEERWHSQTSSFLQVLVSIQSLILVHEPYFNEPGYERSRGTPSGTASSREYDANIRQATVKWAMLEMIKNPPLAFKQIIQWHFWLKKDEIVSQIENWVQETEMYSKDKRVGRNISHSLLLLKRHFAQLKEEFAKMTIPEDVQPVDDDNDDDFTDNNNNNSDDNADDDNDNGISFKVPKECANS